MGVMQDDRRDVEPLREVSTATKTNARPFRPCRDPCESKVGDKVELLPHIVHADVAQPRHVRYLPRDALARTLEEKTEVHPRLDYSLLPYSTGNQVR